MATSTSRSVSSKRRSSRGSGKREAAARVSHQRKQELVGLILMMLAVLVSLAIVTYDPADNRIAALFTLEAALNPAENRAENALGLVGAVLARLLVPGFLGYPVLLFAGLLVAWGYGVFRNRPPSGLTWVTALIMLGTVIAATFAGWLTHVAGMDLGLWSGRVGLGLSDWLSRVLGSVGSFLILQLALVILLLLVVDRDIQRWVDRIEDAGENLWGWIRDRRLSWQENRIARQEEQHRRREERARRREEDQARRQEKRAGDRSAHPVPRPATPEREPAPPPARPEPPVRPAPVRPDAAPAAGEPFPAPASLRSTDRDEKPPVHRTPAPVEEPALTVRERIEEQKVNLDERPAEALIEEIPYHFPSVELLDDAGGDEPHIDYEELEENKQVLLDKLETYNIQITDINAVVGSTVTLYELTPAPGVKISRITALEDDLAMAMAARGIRMIAPIPGKSAIGVEIPNRHREFVRIRSLLGTARFRDAKMELPFVIGKSIEGEVFIEDLTRMPHLLIAGATGSGKSVGLNTLIVGLLYACHPANLKFVLIDPKKVEMSQYASVLGHFVAMPEGGEDPIISDVEGAIGVLKSCEKEMEGRYDLLSSAGVRSVRDYNKRFREGRLNPELDHRHLPYIVVVIDELADLMMVSGKEIEGPIARLAQMARAVGIHLVLATQRPSVDVITGLIKANFPARIAYQVASKIDSRTILDHGGAEGLVGNGDLLYMNGARIIRLQGPFISVEEVEEVTKFIGKQNGPGPYLLPRVMEIEKSFDEDLLESGDLDDLFQDAARIIVRSQQGSVSLLQRKLSIGYTRAARIVDQLEEAGIVGPFEGSKAREVLVQSELQLDEMLKPGS